MALTFWLLLAAAWIASLVPVLHLRRHIDRHAWPAWTAALRGELASHFAYLEELLEGNDEVLRNLAASAEAHAKRGAQAAAKRRLTGVFELVEDCARAIGERLDEWLVVCRAALALYPVESLPTSAFRLPSLRGLAMVHAAAHAVPVTSGERFRLRVRALGWGFRRLWRIAQRAGGRLRRRRGDTASTNDWRASRALVHDFGALSAEALQSARALLRAAETARRADS